MIARLKKNENLFFALRNNKLKIGRGIILIFLALAIFGPLLTSNSPTDYVGPISAPPSADYWFGTTMFGQDIFAQFVYGLRSGSTGIPSCPGVFVDMGGPMVAGSDVANANGEAELTLFVPNAARNRRVLIQAVERTSCVVSNLVQFVFG